MALKNLAAWTEGKAMVSAGSACGSSDKHSACGSSDEHSACGSSDKHSACGASDDK